MKDINTNEITLSIDGKNRNFRYEDEWHEDHRGRPGGQGCVGIRELNQDGKAEGLYVNTYYSDIKQKNNPDYDGNDVIEVGFHKDGKRGPLYTFSKGKLCMVKKYNDNAFPDEYEEGSKEFAAYKKDAPDCKKAFAVFKEVRQAVFAKEVASNKLATLRKKIAHDIDETLGTKLEEKKIAKPLKKIEKAVSDKLFGKVNE